jgi:hypothetical protein
MANSKINHLLIILIIYLSGRGVQPKKKLAFCHEYQGRSCCDRKLTKSIKASVDALVDPACANCYTVVSDYKCAECSPDSGS